MFPYPKDSLSRFVFGSAGSALVVYLLWYGLSNPLTEAVDKVYFAGAITVGVSFCLLTDSTLISYFLIASAESFTSS